MTTIVLDVIAQAAVPEAVDPSPPPPPPSSPSGEVVVIHVAPSPRLDPADPDKLEIVADDDLDGFAPHVRTFIIE
jgi:hypothetical protein